jgi:hypothetical protein
LSDPQQRLARLVPLAESLKAEYLAVDFKVTPEQVSGVGGKVVMQNDTYTLVELNP